MENKLQELTERIYTEGIQKAQEEGDQIIQKARKEAAGELEHARQEAARIIEQAQVRAEEIRKNVAAEVKLTTNQALSSLKTQVTHMISLQMVDVPVKKSFQDDEFIKKLIETLVAQWKDHDNPEGMNVMLPENTKRDLEGYLTTKLHGLLKGGLEIKREGFTGHGFRIGPKDGSYKISFTEEDFINFIKAFLRPRTHQLLFGGSQ